MGTRGAFGFRIEQADKVTYNHYDSYPSGLGHAVVTWIHDTPLDELIAAARNITLVSENDPPTSEQVESCKQWADEEVSGQDMTKEWYVLLRGTQGDPSLYTQGLHYMINSSSFLADSLFCEWAYVVNLDDVSLEVYRGFNKEAGAPGRYAALGPAHGYYGVALVANVSLAQIQESDADGLLALLGSWEKRTDAEDE